MLCPVDMILLLMRFSTSARIFLIHFSLSSPALNMTSSGKSSFAFLLHAERYWSAVLAAVESPFASNELLMRKSPTGITYLFDLLGLREIYGDVPYSCHNSTLQISTDDNSESLVEKPPLDFGIRFVVINSAKLRRPEASPDKVDLAWPPLPARS